MWKIVLFCVSVLSVALAQNLHVASVSRESSLVAASWYDVSVANDINEQWNLDNHDVNVRVELRFALSRNYKVLARDWKKLAGQGYPLVIRRYLTDFKALDSQLFVAEGHMCAGNKFSFLQFPRQCTPFIQVYEFNPSFNKTTHVKDFSNYDSSAHLTGAYCCAGVDLPCGASPASLCPASQVLPTVAKYFNTTLTGKLPNTYERAADMLFSDVHVSVKRRRVIEEIVDDFLIFLSTNSNKDVFSDNLRICLPHSSECTGTRQQLYDLMTTTYGHIKFTPYNIFVAAHDKVYLTGVASISVNGEYEVFDLAFSLKLQGKKIRHVLVATDMSVIAYANNFCVSNDVRCKLIESGTSLSSRFSTPGMSDYKSNISPPL